MTRKRGRERERKKKRMKKGDKKMESALKVKGERERNPVEDKTWRSRDKECLEG